MRNVSTIIWTDNRFLTLLLFLNVVAIKNENFEFLAQHVFKKMLNYRSSLNARSQSVAARGILFVTLKENGIG